MKEIIFEKHFYNGIINPNAVRYNRVKIILDGKNSKKIYTREYFDGDYNSHTISAEVNFFDELDVSNEREYVGYIKFLHERVEDLVNTYREEFFDDSLPSKLAPCKLIVDGKEYVYANIHIDDKDFDDAVYFINNYSPLFRLSNKLLKSIFSNPPYEKKS